MRHVFVRLEELAAERERGQVAALAGPIRHACELHGLESGARVSHERLRGGREHVPALRLGA